MDKFRASASAGALAASITKRGAQEVIFDVVVLSDGGEGFRAAFDGEVVMLRVRDPWGDWHDAPLSIVASSHETLGVIEVAEIIGRSRRPAPTSSEALAASSEGVADAILASVARGVTRVVVGCGGSATSDGGEGCYQVLRRAGGLEVELTAATDVTADYFGALRYAEQKGVATGDLAVVAHRLEHLAERYQRLSGRDVRSVARTGAAGGLSGALYALGANLVSGFDEVARVNTLSTRIAAASRVITGEGRLDAGSLEGKVVSGVCALTNEEQRVLVVCGSQDEVAARELTSRYPWVRVVDLVSRYGERRAFDDTLACVGEVVADFLVNAF
jgi:glycerate kinase